MNTERESPERKEESGFCKNCGAIIHPSAQFCDHECCGAYNHRIWNATQSPGVEAAKEGLMEAAKKYAENEWKDYDEEYVWSKQALIDCAIQDFLAGSKYSGQDQDELWDDLVAEITTFTGASKIEAFRLCEDLKQRGWKLQISK